MPRQLFTPLVVALGLMVGPLLSSADAQEAAPRVPQSQAEISLSFAPLVKAAAPAVVNIYARTVTEARSPFAGDPIFGDFFRQYRARPRVTNSLGSGVILSDDGIVVSNYHVVGQATEIRVVLNDRREYDATVLLGDEETDLAILKLDEARDMPHLELRDSDSVEVGELVLAIGNPFGVGQTVSSGIVSGLARSGTATGNARGYFIQTDAPINPGNSGGALIDVAGRLIGVNTSILTRSGGSNGIGFAIPAAMVAQFVEQARDGNTRFETPWAGVTAQSVDGDLAEGLGLPVPQGVLLSRLHPQSPFAAAGLEVGDVITAVDGDAVNAPPEMLYRLTVRGIGDSARIDYIRQGQPQSATVDLIAPPEVPARDTTTLDQRALLPGLTVARANPALAQELALDLEAEGVVVVDPGPYGARVGLQAGDVIRAVNRAALRAPQDLADLLAKAVPRVQLEIDRQGRRLSLRFRT